MAESRFTATQAKNRFGQVLEAAIRAPVAIEKNGRTVAYVVSAGEFARGGAGGGTGQAGARAKEARLVELAARGDTDPVAWRTLGAAEDMAGVALTLASARGFERRRWLALARALDASMLEPERFSAWLTKRYVDPARFVPMVRQARGARAHAP